MKLPIKFAGVGLLASFMAYTGAVYMAGVSVATYRERGQALKLEVEQYQEYARQYDETARRQSTLDQRVGELTNERNQLQNAIAIERERVLSGTSGLFVYGQEAPCGLHHGEAPSGHQGQRCVRLDTQAATAFQDFLSGYAEQRAELGACRAYAQQVRQATQARGVGWFFEASSQVRE